MAGRVFRPAAQRQAKNVPGTFNYAPGMVMIIRDITFDRIGPTKQSLSHPSGSPKTCLNSVLLRNGFRNRACPRIAPAQTERKSASQTIISTRNKSKSNATSIQIVLSRGPSPAGRLWNHRKSPSVPVSCIWETQPPRTNEAERKTNANIILALTTIKAI